MPESKGLDEPFLLWSVSLTNEGATFASRELELIQLDWCWYELLPATSTLTRRAMSSSVVLQEEMLSRNAGLPSHEDIPNHTSTNDTAGALAAAVGGLGIASTTSWACRMEIESGALVSVLPDWKMAELPVHAYFPMGRTTRMAARAFVDFLSTVLASDPQHFGPLK
jgi:DNA-binding transcriptional LysR family regulator